MKNPLSIKPHPSIADYLKFTSIALYVLAAMCFIVYTTEQSYAFAEGSDSTDLGYDTTSANASVTVGAACTFSGTETSPHTSTISNGLSSNNIGTTVLKTTCNDSGGYALYAIGYTDDTYGNTSLTYTAPDGVTTNSSYNIPTGAATSGNTSSWAVKLDTVPGSTLATIENGYNAYNVIPEDYTKVATLNTITDPDTSTAGSSVSTTYQAYISPTQPAGTYTGKVKYTMVHPSTVPKPEVPLYMQNTALIKRRLTNVGDTAQAIDSRDGKSYWVAKLADGNIWMTQNLDLDIDSTKTYTPRDTDVSTNWIPANTTAHFTDNGIIAGSWSNNNFEPYSLNPGDIYYYTSNNEDSDITYSTLSACQKDGHIGCEHYHAGNYYNWSAAVASNDTSAIPEHTDAPNSICPAGWRLPTNNESEELYNLLMVQGDIVGEILPWGSGYYYADGGLNRIRSSPLWFTRAGYISYYGTSGGWRKYMIAAGGVYWASTSRENYGNYHTAHNLSFRQEYILPSTSSLAMEGASIRCIAR